MNEYENLYRRYLRAVNDRDGLPHWTPNIMRRLAEANVWSLKQQLIALELRIWGTIVDRILEAIADDDHRLAA